MPFSQWEKHNPTMIQTDFASGKNTVRLAKNIYAKESLVSKKEKKCLYLVLPEKCIEQREQTLLENSHSFLATHLSSNSTRRGNPMVVQAKDHFSTEMRTQH